MVNITDLQHTSHTIEYYIENAIAARVTNAIDETDITIEMLLEHVAICINSLHNESTAYGNYMKPNAVNKLKNWYSNFYTKQITQANNSNPNLDLNPNPIVNPNELTFIEYVYIINMADSLCDEILHKTLLHELNHKIYHYNDHIDINIFLKIRYITLDNIFKMLPWLSSKQININLFKEYKEYYKYQNDFKKIVHNILRKNYNLKCKEDIQKILNSNLTIMDKVTYLDPTDWQKINDPVLMKFVFNLVLHIKINMSKDTIIDIMTNKNPIQLHSKDSLSIDKILAKHKINNYRFTLLLRYFDVITDEQLYTIFCKLFVFKAHGFAKSNFMASYGAYTLKHINSRCFDFGDVISYVKFITETFTLICSDIYYKEQIPDIINYLGTNNKFEKFGYVKGYYQYHHHYRPFAIFDLFIETRCKYYYIHSLTIMITLFESMDFINEKIIDAFMNTYDPSINANVYGNIRNYYHEYIPYRDGYAFFRSKYVKISGIHPITQ